MFENGQAIFEKTSTTLVSLGKIISKGTTFNFVSAGCAYKDSSHKYMMHGQMTDVQAWNKEVDSSMLESITSCKGSVFLASLKFVLGRAGHLGLAGWQYNSNSYFQANLTIILRLLLEQPMKIPYSNQIGIRENAALLKLLWSKSYHTKS